MRPTVPALLLLALAIPAVGAVEEVEEWISIPKHFLRHLDIPLVDDALAPSAELHQLLMLSEPEAAALQAALVGARDEFLALVVERSEIVTAQADKVELEVPLIGAAGEAIAERCHQAILAALGAPRAELLDLVRNDRWRDRLAEALYGEAFDGGFDYAATITFEAQQGGGWRRTYETRNEDGLGRGRSSSSGGSLDAYEQRLAEAVLARARAEGDAEAPAAVEGEAAPADEQGFEVLGGELELEVVEPPVARP